MRPIRKLKERFSTFVPVLLAAALLTVGLWRHHENRWRASEADVAFSGHLRPARLTRADGGAFSIADGRSYLLLFANPQDDAELLKYLSYVANTSALARRLQVVVFYSSQYRGMPGALVDSSSLPFPAIDVDANGRQLQDSLGVRHTLRKAILTDEHLNVRFAANFFKKNDARALLGRYVGQEWSRYPAEAKRIPLGVGDPMIDTGVKNLRSGEILPDLPPDIRTWIVLTARCTSCTLANTLTELDTATLPSTEWTHMGLLFSRYFPETAILPRLSALHVRVPAFIATSELQGPEDPYWQRSLGPDSEITVQVRDDHVISGIGRFESLIRPPSH